MKCQNFAILDLFAVLTYAGKLTEIAIQELSVWHTNAHKNICMHVLFIQDMLPLVECVLNCAAALSMKTPDLVLLLPWLMKRDTSNYITYSNVLYS